MRTALLLILGVALGAAQSPRADVLREIRAEGHKRLSEAEVIKLSGLKPGDPATAATFEAMRDRILETGCIETVGWRWEPLTGGGFTATIEITEAGQLLPWGVDRLPLTAEEIAALGAKEIPCFGPEIPTYDRYLERAAAAVTRLARARGFDDEVVAQVGVIGRDEPTVLFQPKTPAPSIADARFTGNEAIDEKWLRRQMNEVARGARFSENLYRQFLESQIRPMYENVGRLTVEFGKITLEPATDVKGVVVTTEVIEGPVYELEDVEISGIPLSAERIEELAEYKRGEPVSYSKMAQTMEKLFQDLRNNGYLKPSYQAKRQLFKEKLTVRLMVDVETGPQFRMGRLTIRGLDVIGEPVVRKMWTLQPGDPFRQDYPNFFVNTVKERGLFDFLANVRAETKINDDNRTVDVTLFFEAGAQGLDSRATPKPKPQP
jgi:outer membrane protein insertion porin family